MKIFKRLLPYFRKYKYKVIVGLLFVVIANFFQMLNPWVLRRAINGLEDQFSHQYLILSGVYLLSIAVASGFFRFLMRKTIIGVSRNVEYDLRQTLFRHYLNLEPAFYDHNRVGDLMTRATSDIEQVRMVFGPALMYMTNTLFGLTFGLALMISISVKLTLIVAAIVPVMAVNVFFVGRKMHAASKASQEAFSDLSSTVQENLSGIRVIKAYRQEDHQKKLFEISSRNYFSKNLKQVYIQGIFFPFIMSIFGAAVAAILLIGGYQIIVGNIRIGDFVAFVSYLMLLAWPMISIGWVVGLIQRGAVSLQRLVTILDEEPQHNHFGNGKDANTIMKDKSVAFHDVELTYPKAVKPSLTNVSFELLPGRTLGIVGRVGSGKSSIVSALTGLYTAQKGEISIGGIPIHDWDLRDLREHIAIVPQDPILFSTTIRENITFANGDLDGELEEAIQISRLVQDIQQFPDGIETEVGERGITLSGGQKQRVAIARAVIRNPDILILDDALSAVDSSTEHMIVENLNRYMEGKTSIIVTHRLSTVQDADEIIVMDQGKIAERGKHKALLEINGIYAELWKRQQLAKELEEAE